MKTLLKWNRLKESYGLQEAEKGEAIYFMNMASSVFSNMCNRKFLYDSFTEYYDAPGDECILIKNWPVVAIQNVWYDPLKEFGSDTLLDSSEYMLSAENGELWVPKKNPDYKAFKIEYTAGFLLPDYDYRYENPTEGMVIFDSDDGLFYKYTGGAWALYTPDSGVYNRLPGDVELAVSLLFYWYYRKVKSGEVGVVQKSRGYAYEGSGMSFAQSVPPEILSVINSYRSYR